MTIRVTVRNSEQETSRHNLIVGVLDSHGDEFVERHIVEPETEVVINLWGSRTIVVTEAPAVIPVPDSGAPSSPVVLAQNVARVF